MAIIIADIHGDIEMAEAFLSYKREDVHICLGDLVDSRKGSGLEAEKACLGLRLRSNAILIWGNHDLAYLPERPWRCFGKYGELAFREEYQLSRGDFQAAYAIDGWLCTHAGVSPKVAKLVPEAVHASGAEAIASWLNQEFARQLQIRNPIFPDGEPRYGNGPLFNIAVCRGGTNEYGGIFWFDAEGEQTQPSPKVGRQVFGHTPGVSPKRGRSRDILSDEEAEWINLDVAEGGIWIFDTVTDELVNLLR